MRNRLTERPFARRAAGAEALPEGAVAVFFATGPENLYQFEQWRLPLEQLARTRPVFVIVDRPDTGQALLGTTSLPVTFARSSSALETLVGDRDVRVVLYLNQVEPNFRMLRFPEPVHVQIGHGESDKGGSVSHQHLAYDLTLVGGAAGQRRLGEALRGFDPDQRTLTVGRPQLDHAYPGAPGWREGSGLRVWYAPTWEGDRPSIAYGSLASHGVALVDTLLGDPGIRLIYRPHPRTGQASAAHRAADRAIRARLAAAGERHLVDQAGYGWAWRFADACVTDISAAAYDWLATGKPLLVTEPVERRAYRPASPLLDELGLLPAAGVGEVADLLRAQAEDLTLRERRAELTDYYFGEVADAASTRRFAAAIDRAYELQRS